MDHNNRILPRIRSFELDRSEKSGFGSDPDMKSNVRFPFWNHISVLKKNTMS